MDEQPDIYQLAKQKIDRLIAACSSKKPTITASVEVSIDTKQSGPVVAVRRLPLGDAVLLADICDPEYGVPDRVITIGRGEEMDVCVDEGRVSDLHCVLYRCGEEVYVEDRASKNGTFVGRTLLRPYREVQVFPGQVIQLGGPRASLLLCNQELNDCPVDIIATSIDLFYVSAWRRFQGKLTLAAHKIGASVTTFCRRLVRHKHMLDGHGLQYGRKDDR